jgi:hypothetical protein
MNEVKKLLATIEFNDKEKEMPVFEEWISFNGADKCYEILNNLKELVVTNKINFVDLINFSNYELKLSEILFTLLRIQENHVKAFLSNTFDDYQVQIEARPSNYSKTKYYFKIPVGVNEYLDIRTFNYEEGPVDYYDAIKTIDFGDINLIMFHLPSSLIQKFSQNPDILDDLDKTRKLRNYVYHHNILFSLGKKELLNALTLTLRNLPYRRQRKEYIDKINCLRFSGVVSKKDIGSNIAITINDNLAKEIIDFTSLDTF